MAEGALQPTDTLQPELGTMRLDMLCANARAGRLDRLDRYYRCTQYDDRRFDWDGRMLGYGASADIAPGWYVPLNRRRPRARYDLAKLIVKRFTAMLFGTDRFPQITVPDDEAANDYLQQLVRESRMPARVQEARNYGGACGTAVMSFGFVDGTPRTYVHQAKHMHPLQWHDRQELRLAKVLEAYRYPRTVWMPDGRPKEVDVYFARYWDQEVEVVWDPIPVQVAKLPDWHRRVPSKAVQHGFGFCPVYWCQNIPDSDALDGASDYEGMLDQMDDINTLLSATGKGTVANVDPTLVVKDDPQRNTGQLRKGSENAIYSKGGADYLTLPADAVTAAMKVIDAEKGQLLDEAGVVLGDADKITSKAQSAAALRMLYMPMMVEADTRRDQYGPGLIEPLCRDMLRAARMIGSKEPGPVEMTADGRRVQQRPVVRLAPRMEDGVPVERVPGESEVVELNWPPYFPNTWADNKTQVETADMAVKGKLVSRRTATENVGPIFGVHDAEAEQEEIEEQAASDVALQQEAFSMGGPPPTPPPKPPPKGGPAAGGLPGEKDEPPEKE